jgi:hypothetical protein
MNWPHEAAIVVGMFVLRLGVPLVITLVVAYSLRRLDAKWQAEASEQWETIQPQEKLVAETERFQAGKQPCWSLKRCDETVAPTALHPNNPTRLVG